MSDYVKKTLAAAIIIAIMPLMTGCTSFGKSSWSFLFSGSKRYSIIRTAEKYLGVRYKFGGDTPRGFDCSGFSMYVYKVHGVILPHSAGQQYARGRRVGIKNARPGDLVFFKIYGRKISHVGVYAGNYKFIHAPSRGKRVSYDDIRKDYWRKRYAGTVTFF